MSCSMIFLNFAYVLILIVCVRQSLCKVVWIGIEWNRWFASLIEQNHSKKQTDATNSMNALPVAVLASQPKTATDGLSWQHG